MRRIEVIIYDVEGENTWNSESKVVHIKRASGGEDEYVAKVLIGAAVRAMRESGFRMHDTDRAYLDYIVDQIPYSEQHGEQQ